MALGKSPLVLMSLANLTIDENIEAGTKVILTAQQKLSPIHCFTSK
jgi:hypothetical protein